MFILIRSYLIGIFLRRRFLADRHTDIIAKALLAKYSILLRHACY